MDTESETTITDTIITDSSYGEQNEEHLPSMSNIENRLNCNPSSNNGESESSALLGLFCYSAMMFTIPLGGFILVKNYLQQNYDLGDTYNLLVPIVVAVILVNLIIMLYVFRAFREDTKDRSYKERPIEERKKLE